jgi:hypothetical protein
MGEKAFIAAELEFFVNGADKLGARAVVEAPVSA